MTKRILVDGAYEEEIRLALVENEIIKSFDYHRKSKSSIKGNVYLVKVTRVESSLQAAFVEYGGNKQGFLPLSEIHPDYYQIPKKDKEELMKSFSQARSEDDQFDDSIDSQRDTEEESLIRPSFYKKYKIQEVVKKDQIMLAQIIKEERGNKGASLSTYISLAGRYCVLLPNSSNAGGMSRKIGDSEERARLRALIKELSENLENSSSFIIRTAGAHKTKAEIKRDLGYLNRLWNNIRQHTLSSTAPAFIHEEGDIIKKAIRDLYDSDVEEIAISGEEAYENAKNFMKLLLPRHIDKIILYNDDIPIFSKYKIEDQLSQLYDNKIELASKSHIVIDQTEALVSIDVNSGKYTGEKSIENTALKTNLEAAVEIAKQLRLRDLSGLIVIDFIDMAESKNRNEVEKVLKNALSKDKARTQMGKISEFGLLEMSRQRLNQSFIENHMLHCNYCSGRGKIRPQNVTSIAIMRAIENEIAGQDYDELRVTSSQSIILYLLNNRCGDIARIEDKYKIKLSFDIDNEESGADGFFLEGVKLKLTSKQVPLSGIDLAPYRTEEQEVPFKKRRNNFDELDKKNNNKDPLDISIDEKISIDNDELVTKKIKNKENNKQKAKPRKRFRINDEKVSSVKVNNGDDDMIIMNDGHDEVSYEAKNDNDALLKKIWKKIVH